MDNLTDADRSKVMSLVGKKHTGPEMIVRRLAHAMGYRYNLHDRNLPGTPDIVFRRQRKVILVHGCFWHRHPGGCSLTRTPKSNVEFWQAKFDRNRRRDRKDRRTLLKLGWSVMTIWECEARDLDRLASRLREFLGPARSPSGP